MSLLLREDFLSRSNPDESLDDRREQLEQHSGRTSFVFMYIHNFSHMLIHSAGAGYASRLKPVASSKPGVHE